VDLTEPLLIFLHNMRTGGETLRTLMVRQYGGDQVCTVLGKIERPGDIRELRELDPRTTRLIQGHIPFGVHEFVPRDTVYVTMLREPLARAVSLYYHIVEDPTSGYYRLAERSLASLEDFISSGIVLEVDNGQTRRLSGDDPPFGQCTADMFERAKEVLRERCAVVGLTERFDESLILMKRAFGWQHVLYHKLNVTKTKRDRPQLSEDTLKLIQRHSALDQELFAYAQELLEAQLARQDSDFAHEVHAFKLLNGALAKRRSERLGKTIRADEPCLETAPGLHGELAIPATLLDAHAHALARETELVQETIRRRRRQARLERKNTLLRKRLARAQDRLRQMQGTRIWRLTTWYRETSVRLRALFHL
jgi:hypothetical protein